MKPSLLTKLSKLIEGNPTYIVEGKLNKNLLAADARKYDKNLLDTLQKDKEIKEHFFTDTRGGLVFKKDVFLQFISNKEFLPDSYTRYANMIGLGSDDGSLLSGSKDVVLNWPYKDAILEGGQDKEDQKRSEVFFNEVLAPDQITRLLDDKVFTNWKRYDRSGEQDLDELKDDDNLIIKGNNLVVLHSLKKRYAGKVKLIYIDPPYNTGEDSFGYNDRFTRSTWLTFMKNRLEAATKLLDSDGLLAVQVDDNQYAFLYTLIHELYGGEDSNLKTVVVKMSEASGLKMGAVKRTGRLPKYKEYIILAKRGGVKGLQPDLIAKNTWDKEYNIYLENFSSDDREYINSLSEFDNVNNEQISKVDSILARVETKNLSAVERELPEDTDVSAWRLENSWRIVRTAASSSVFKLVEAKKKQVNQSLFSVISKRDGILYIAKSDYSVDAKQPRVQLLFADDALFVHPGDLWTDIKTTGIERQGGVQLKNGKKPEDLLQRLISMSTKAGDIVLDYHLGSGTTAAVAHKLGRRYIGIEQLYYGDNDPAIRLQNVINGDQTGISKSVNWQGGGSFVYVNIMNNSNKFRKRVESAKDDKEYLALLEEARSSSFLSYRVDPTKLNETEFRKLSSADKRRLLLELIDNNTLYVNYEDINDPSFKVSDSDKKFNKELYK